MTTPLDTHKALFFALYGQYGEVWPKDALLQIGYSFALTYGELPIEPSFRHAWFMPSKQTANRVYTWTAYRVDLLGTYPALTELPLWGTDILRPMVTVRCLRCAKPYQTRNAAKWRLHPRCREHEAEEDATWMNGTEVGQVRTYDDLAGLAQCGTQIATRRKGRPQK